MTQTSTTPRGRADPLGRAPLVLMIPAAGAVLLLLLPLGAMVVATDPGSLVDALGTEALQQALWLSFCLLYTSDAADE